MKTNLGYKIPASIIFSFTILFVLQGCKKYDDDKQLIHFRTVPQRITGKREIKTFRWNNIDLLSVMQKRYGDFYVEFSYDDPNNITPVFGRRFNVYQKKTDSLLCDGTWGFRGVDRRYIFIGSKCIGSDTSSLFPEYVDDLSGTIVKLSNKELICKHPDPANTPISWVQELHFVKYKD